MAIVYHRLLTQREGFVFATTDTVAKHPGCSVSHHIIPPVMLQVHAHRSWETRTASVDDRNQHKSNVQICHL